MQREKKKENTYNTCEKLIRLPKICEVQMEKERQLGKEKQTNNWEILAENFQKHKNQDKEKLLKVSREKTYIQETRKMAELS